MLFKFVMWPLQPIMFTKGETVPAVLLPHETNWTLPKWKDSSAVVSLWLCLPHGELNEKVKQGIVQVRAETVERNLVPLRITYLVCYFFTETLRLFFCWDISVICLIAVLKLDIVFFISLDIFRHFDWKISCCFFLFKNISVYDWKKTATFDSISWFQVFRV